MNAELKVYLIKTLGAFQTLDATLADGRKVDPIEPLTEALEPGHESAIRMEAAASLAKQAARLEGKLDDPRAVAALGEAAADGEPELRQVAVYALGFFGGEAARQALRERLQSDENRFVRYNAAVALGRRGDPAAKATLREMLSTADLDRVIDLTSTTEKQNKIEAIELEALQALQSSLSDRLARTGSIAPSGDRRIDAVRPRERSQPGPGGLAKITTSFLTGARLDRHPRHVDDSFDRAGRSRFAAFVAAGHLYSQRRSAHGVLLQ